MDIIASPTPDARQLLPGAGAQVRQFPNVGAYRFFIAPEQWVGPLADKRVRQAMNFAINKQQMIDVAFGGDGVPLRGQILREGFIGYNPNVEPYAYNPTRRSPST
jgi:peptide/nickel transport system substrate-binding protein